jgi:hypothetical protein
MSTAHNIHTRMPPLDPPSFRAAPENDKPAACDTTNVLRSK